MLDRLRRRILREMYDPRALGLLVNPFFIARRELRKQIASLAPRVRGRTLDVGCGKQPYLELFTATTEYVGMELDTPENRASKRADTFYDGTTFPFDAQRFDAVIIFQVIEHVFNPDQFLAEVHRVLVPGGTLLLTVPFVWDEHEQPYDYARYSSFGLRHLLETHGFEVVEQRKSVDNIRVISQLINCYLYKKTVTDNAYVNMLTTAALMAPVTLSGELLARVLPGNSDLYLDNVVLARRG
jgi:SAM-dependent methyltransferase